VVSANVRMSRDGMLAVGGMEEGVDVFCWQEVPIIDEEKMYRLEGYDSIEGVGGYLEKGEGAAVCMMVHEKCRGRWKVIKRSRKKIGVVLEWGEKRKLEIWNIYVGSGKHRRFEWVEGDRNGIVMGDINARSKRWSGEEGEENREGRIVEEWMDEWGWKVGTERGVVTRRGEKEGVKDGVLDVGFYVGGVMVEGRTWDWVGSLDHRPVEMVVEVIGEELKRKEEREGKVDWERVEAELRLMKGEGGGDVVGREELERRVEVLENRVMEVVRGNKGKGKWKYGKKVWWNGVIEKEYEEVKEEERKWMENGRKEGKDKVKESRRKWKKVVEQVKREHWLKYLEGLEERDGYKWVKTDRDFLVDIPGIRNEDGEMVEEDEEKARALVRGLGKRKEEEQELEGFYEKVEVEEEELGEMIRKQGDGKAAGENGLGGKVLKMMWRVDWCRKEMKEVVEGSLSLGYVCERWRRSVGIVMRKPNKLDYGSPNSYRIINLLDVLGKVVERILARRLEKWGQVGMGDEQFGGRVGRSCMDGVGKLYKDWEEGGRKGLLLCMDVKGGYDNVGVNKAMERLEGLGVDGYMVRWVSSFL